MPSTRRATAAIHAATSTTARSSHQHSLPPSLAIKSLPFDPTPLPTPEILLLRRDWRFAALCQFISTFEEAIQLKEFETEELEDDLTLGTLKIVPQLVYRFLHVLTSDRRISAETWEHHLRIQYLRREPKVALLGTEEEPIEWRALPQSDKLGALHTTTEWQFANPAKLRKAMKDEEQNQLWRIEPIGYDAQGNALWLFDDNRLWIQRVPPKPKVSHKKKTLADRRPPPAKKQKVTASKAAPKEVPAKPVPVIESKAATRYPKRAVKALPKPPTVTSPVKQRPMGTRMSSRLHGVVVEEEWQEIPPEWLAEGAPPPKVNGKGKNTEETSKGRKRPFEEDESDLTELSEDDVEQKPALKETKEAEVERVAKQEDVLSSAVSSSLSSTPVTDPTFLDAAASAPPPAVPDDFVEWETLCVTLYEWENIADRFSNSMNKNEKALYRLLVDQVVPRVVVELREIERLKKLQDAVANRKRSSRLVMRELEKETQMLEEKKRLEEEEKMQRSRRYEARLKREEEERNKESERERRVREREERAARGRKGWQPLPSAEMQTPDIEMADAPGDLEVVEMDEPPRVVTASSRVNGTSRADETWELDCEICGQKGFNINDGSEVTCCETCNKWQHVRCHDNHDVTHGKSKRRWESVSFKCKSCKNKQRRDRYARKLSEHKTQFSVEPQLPSEDQKHQQSQQGPGVTPEQAHSSAPHVNGFKAPVAKSRQQSQPAHSTAEESYYRHSAAAGDPYPPGSYAPYPQQSYYAPRPSQPGPSTYPAHPSMQVQPSHVGQSQQYLPRPHASQSSLAATSAVPTPPALQQNHQAFAYPTTTSHYGGAPSSYSFGNTAGFSSSSSTPWLSSNVPASSSSSPWASQEHPYYGAHPSMPRPHGPVQAPPHGMSYSTAAPRHSTWAPPPALNAAAQPHHTSVVQPGFGGSASGTTQPMSAYSHGHWAPPSLHPTQSRP